MPSGEKEINNLIKAGQRVTDAKEDARARADGELPLIGASQEYLNLVKSLVDRNQLSSEELARIVASDVPVNPCDFADTLYGEEELVYSRVYDQALKKGLDWPSIRRNLSPISDKVRAQEGHREKAKIDTGPLDSLRTVGALWCGLFDHGGWFPHIRVPNLDFAYRGPSLFLSEIRKKGAEVAFLLNDERITKASLRSRAGEMGKASVVYFCTHGKCPSSGYEAYLHRDTWRPGKGCFDADVPNVLVFDTCNLIEADHGWEGSWAEVVRGSSVHLLLGFKGLTSIDPASSRRGAAFAENLMRPKQMSYADAWIAAVDRTAVTRNSRAVAIGVGKTPVEARDKLRLTMDDTSTPHKVTKLDSGPLFFAIKDLHETRVSDTAF